MVAKTQRHEHVERVRVCGNSATVDVMDLEAIGRAATNATVMIAIQCGGTSPPPSSGCPYPVRFLAVEAALLLALMLTAARTAGESQLRAARF